MACAHVVPVIRSCQSPILIWLVNYLHLRLHTYPSEKSCIDRLFAAAEMPVMRVSGEAVLKLARHVDVMGSQRNPQTAP